MDSLSFPFNPLDFPGCLDLPRKYCGYAWKEHIPFAMSLVQMVKPRVLVELGVHMGDSYLAFCQAIAAQKLETKAYGVDTWQGDAHAGHYSETVYDELQAYHGPNYSTFSQLIRSTFDVAVKEFGDGSIDLLHIDGYHTYEVVKHDWETWQPKMSSRGVVLFHDTNVHERNFGVWRLWDELKAVYPHFEFIHGHGLGVLAYGRDIPADLARFVTLKEDERSVVMRFFSRVGHYLTLQKELAARIATVETAEVIRQIHASHQEAIAKLSSEHSAALKALSAEQAIMIAAHSETLAKMSSEHSAAIKVLSAEQVAVNAAHQETLAKISTEHGATLKALNIERLTVNASYQVTLAKLNAEHGATIATMNADASAQRAEFERKCAERDVCAAELNIKLAEKSDHLKRVYARSRWMDRCDALLVSGQHERLQPLGVLFVSDSNDAPQMYRVQNAVEQLHAGGCYARHVNLAQCRTEWLESFNVVVFFRQAYNARVQELLDAAKRFNVATIFDCDTPVFFNGSESSVTPATQDLEKTFRACEWFLGNTPALVDHAVALGLPGLLHRDALSAAQLGLGNWLYSLRKLHASEPLLGYFSDANGRNEDFRSIEDGLEHVLDSHKNAKLVFVGSLPSERLQHRFPRRILHVRYDLKWDEYPAIMARCHAVLMPVAQTPLFAQIAQSTSARRFLEAGIVGTPVIASPIDELRRIVVDGHNGWLAETSADWTGRISAALETAQSIRAGQAARETVLAAQSIQAAKGRLSALLRGIVRNDSKSLVEPPAEIALSAAPHESLRQKLKYVKRLSILLYRAPERWSTPLS